jgi:hypothetical protein
MRFAIEQKGATHNKLQGHSECRKQVQQLAGVYFLVFLLSTNKTRRFTV